MRKKSLLQNPIYIGKIRHKELIHEGQHDGIIPQALWDEVQKLLKTNRVERANTTNARSPSLLAGMLEDTHGIRFNPSYCKKETGVIVITSVRTCPCQRVELKCW